MIIGLTKHSCPDKDRAQPGLSMFALSPAASVELSLSARHSAAILLCDLGQGWLALSSTVPE